MTDVPDELLNEILALADMVEKASEGGYFLDEEIHLALGEPERGLFDPPDASRGEEVSHTDAGNMWKINRWSDAFSSSTPMPKYSLSIDAALALVERQCGTNWYSVLLDAMRDFGTAGTLGPESLPRFILIALFRSIITELQARRKGETP